MQGQKKKEVKIYLVSISTKMFRRHLKGVFAPKYNYIYFRSTCVINKFCISLTCLEFFNSKGHVKFWFLFFFPLPCFFHHVFDIHVLAPFCFKSYLPVFCICFFLMLIEAIRWHLTESFPLSYFNYLYFGFENHGSQLWN